MINTVLHWHNMGINCIPCYPNSKRLLKGTRLKEYNNLVPFYNTIRAFYNQNYNLALYPNYSPITGKYLVILDFDTLPEYWLSWNRVNTLETSTHRGYHVYLWSIKDPAGLESGVCEIKYRRPVMIPPSTLGRFCYTDNGKEIATVDRLEDVLRASRVLPSKKKGSAQCVNLFFTRRHTLIDTIKASLPITALFPHYYLSSDNKAIAHCPTRFHSNGDRNPSLSLDLESNRFRCFKPSCCLSLPHGGDVIDAYRILNDLSFKQALAQIALEIGL